jgi:DNA-binding CsgD family transcriptional regulator
MTLAIGWLHEAGDPPHPALRGGSMTLAIRWLHEGGETLGTWLHEAGDWHLAKPVQPRHLLEFVRELQLEQVPSSQSSLAGRSVKTYADAFGLSERERQVLDYCIAGYGRKEIAAALGIGVGSIHRLWGRILARTGNSTQDGVLTQLIRHVAQLPAVPAVVAS